LNAWRVQSSVFPRFSPRKFPNPDSALKKVRRLASIWMKPLIPGHQVDLFGPIRKLMMATA
jgi:hypothetical protein